MPLDSDDAVDRSAHARGEERAVGADRGSAEERRVEIVIGEVYRIEDGRRGADGAGFDEQVGRALLGGFEGVAGSIGTTPSGETATYSFDTYTLPAQYNEKHVDVVIMVLDPQGRIVNGASVELGSEPSSTFYVNDKAVNWNVAPNPISTQATITIELPEPGDVELVMVDMLGRQVWSRNYQDQYGTVNMSFNRGSIPAGIEGGDSPMGRLISTGESPQSGKTDDG